MNLRVLYINLRFFSFMNRLSYFLKLNFALISVAFVNTTNTYSLHS